MCALHFTYFCLCSSGHDSQGNPSQSYIIQLVSSFSSVFSGPCWYPAHNGTLGSLLPACNPSILSNQSALLQQKHISTVTEGGFTTSGAPREKEREREGRWGVSVKRKCENNLVGRACRFAISTTSCSLFWCRSLSGQIVVRACPLQSWVFLRHWWWYFDADSCHCNPISLLLFYFYFFFQPSESVRGYHSSKTAAISQNLGSNWTSGSGGGQGTWSSSSFTRGSLQHYISHHQHHPHHHPPSTHTSYTYCTAHTAVSNAFSLFLYENICLFFTFWNPLVAVSVKHILPVCTQNILISPLILSSYVSICFLIFFPL